jgi:hypothetical protein
MTFKEIKHVTLHIFCFSFVCDNSEESKHVLYDEIFEHFYVFQSLVL